MVLCRGKPAGPPPQGELTLAGVFFAPGGTVRGMCGCDPIADAWEDKIEGISTPAPMQVTVPGWFVVDGGDDPWAHGVVCTGCAEVTRID